MNPTSTTPVSPSRLPAATPEMSARTVISLLAVCTLVGATTVSGATEHGSALLLRGVVIVACIVWWPRGIVSARAFDLVLPAAAMGAVTVGVLTSSAGGAALQDLVRAGLVSALFLTLLLGYQVHWPKVAIAGAAVVALHVPWAWIQRAGGAARGSGGFFNPNDLAAFLAPMLFIALERAEAPPKQHKPLWLTVAVLAAVGLLATASRSGLLAAAAAGTLWLVALLRERPHLWTARWKLAWSLMGTTALGTLAGLTAERWSTRNDPQAFDRLSIWERTIELAMSHPWGVGLGGYTDAMRQLGVPTSGMVRYARTAHHAHSEPLHLWAELGWVGAALVLLIAAYIALRLWGSQQRLRNAAVAVAFAVPALVSASLHVPVVALLGAAWLGHLARGSRRTSFVSPRRGWIALLLVLLGAAALPGWISHTARQRAAQLRDAGRLEEASRWAERAATAAPWSVGAAMLVESLEHRRGRPPHQSVQALLQLAERFPRSPLPLPRAAWLLERMARAAPTPEQARELWQQAAEVRALASARVPFNALERVAWGEAAYAAGNVHRAREIFEAAVELEPHCARALAWLARLARERQEPQQAQALAQRAHRAAARAPDHADYSRQVLSLPPSYATMADD